MSDYNSMLEDITAKTAVLKENKVAKTAYTDTAYATDDAEGVASYAYAQEQNIPDIASIDTNDKILTKGFRSQSASVPRMYLNHMFGRISYNLNKAVDYIHTIAQAVTELNRLGGKYSETTRYRQFDTCSYPIAVGENTRLMRFIRVSDSPEFLVGVPPVGVGGAINSNWADAYSYKANLASPVFSSATQSDNIAVDNDTKLVANTEFVQDVASAILAEVATKADSEDAVLTGAPTATTPDVGDDSDRIATTSFVASSVEGAVATSSARRRFFDTSGTFTVPEGVSELYATGVAKGGDGGNSSSPYGDKYKGGKGGGGGGGAGQIVLKKRLVVTPGEELAVNFSETGYVILGSLLSLAPGIKGNNGSGNNTQVGAPGANGASAVPGTVSFARTGGGGGGGGAGGNVGTTAGAGGAGGAAFFVGADVDAGAAGGSYPGGKAGDGGRSGEVLGGTGFRHSGYQEGCGGGGGGGASSPWGRGGTGGNGSPYYNAAGSAGADATGYGSGGGGAGGNSGRVSGTINGGLGSPGFLLLEW